MSDKKSSKKHSKSSSKKQQQQQQHESEDDVQQDQDLADAKSSPKRANESESESDSDKKKKKNKQAPSGEVQKSQRNAQQVTAPTPTPTAPAHPVASSVITSMQARKIAMAQTRNDWRISLSEEEMKNWKLVAATRLNDNLEYGGNVMFGDTKYKALFRPPLAKVISCTVHAVGLKRPKEEERQRVYKLKLEYVTDDWVLQLVPTLAADQAEFWTRLEAARRRVAKFMWNTDSCKKQKKETFITQAVNTYCKYQEPNADDARKQELKKDEDIIEEAFQSYLEGMSYWKRFPNPQQQEEGDGDRKILRTTRSVCYKEKRNDDDKDKKSDKSSDTKGWKQSSKKKGQKDDAAKGSEAKDSGKSQIDKYKGRGGKMSYQELIALEAQSNKRYDELSIEEVTVVLNNLKDDGYNFLRQKFMDVETGGSLDLGRHGEDVTYRPVIAGDYVTTDIGWWVSSQKEAAGMYNIKLKHGQIIHVLRQPGSGVDDPRRISKFSLVNKPMSSVSPAVPNEQNVAQQLESAKQLLMQYNMFGTVPQNQAPVTASPQQTAKKAPTSDANDEEYEGLSDGDGYTSS